MKKQTILSSIMQALRYWTLPIAMLSGVLIYVLYQLLSPSASWRALASSSVQYIQPLLLFLMMFLTFCKIEVRVLRLAPWHFRLLAVQALGYLGFSAWAYAWNGHGIMLAEGLALCLICPTAASAAVVVRKLGGSAERLTAYTIISNLLTTVIIPLTAPILHPHTDVHLWNAMLTILSKVFPLLLFPLLLAMAVRRWTPRFHTLCVRYPDLSFYLWAVGLMLAIIVTTKAVWHSTLPFLVLMGLALVSLVSCLFQFYVGRRLSAPYQDRVAGGQSLGQKNTIFGIWMAYTFFTPVTAMALGFYSIWHNLVNSYQLYQWNRQEKRQ